MAYTYTYTYTGVIDTIYSIEMPDENHIIVQFINSGKYEVNSRNCRGSVFEKMKKMKAGDKVQVATHGDHIGWIYPIKSVRIKSIISNKIETMVEFEGVEGRKRVFFTDIMGFKPGDMVNVVIKPGNPYCDILGEAQEQENQNGQQTQEIEDRSR